jgi:hypothetical protein
VNLYWAEGFKKDNQVGFSNSDSLMIKLFVLWLRNCCGVESERLRFRIGVNEQHKARVVVIEEYWSNFLGVSKNQFQKPFFQKSQWKKVYENSDQYYGVLRVRVTKSTDLLRLIMGWINGLKINTEYKLRT